jgi:hypothetical protein
MSLEQIKTKIEKDAEAKCKKIEDLSISVIANTASKPEFDEFEKKVINILQAASDEFQATTGRPMTYSEMRQRFG